MDNTKKKLEFIRKRSEWKKNPKLFLEDVLGVKCPSHQAEIINAVFKNKRVSVRSANSVGKSFCLSALILWFFYCYMDLDPKKNLIVLFTAPSWDQVRENIYANVKQFINDAEANLKRLFGEEVSFLGKISQNQNTAEIRFREKDYIKGATSEKGENKTVGKHGTYVLIVYDEAQGIPEKSYSDYRGITKSGLIVKEVMIGNTTLPFGKQGRFFESFGKNSIFHQIKISAFDTQAFIECDLKLEDYFRETNDKDHWKNKVDRYCLKNYKNIEFDAIKNDFENFQDFEKNLGKIFPYKNAVANNNEELWELCMKVILPFCSHIVNPQEVYNELYECGFNPDSYEFKTRVLAEFPDEAGASLFPSKAIQSSFDNYDRLEAFEPGPTRMGVDVAGGYGKDNSSICVVYGNKEIYREEFDVKGVELVDTIEEKFKLFRPENIRIERDAIGSPIVDFCRDRGLPVIGVHMGGAPGYEDPFSQEEIEATIAAKEKFNCKRDEIHWHFRELINPLDPKVKQFLIKPDPEMKRVISAYLYRINPKTEKIQVISKEDLYKILKRSPDNLDSLLLATAEVSSDETILNSDFVFITGH